MLTSINITYLGQNITYLGFSITYLGKSITNVGIMYNKYRCFFIINITNIGIAFFTNYNKSRVGLFYK